MGFFEPDFSNLQVRTIEGLRVALAGLPDDLPVDVEGVVLDAMNVGELRALDRLPLSLRIRIAFRVTPDSRVHVSPAA